MRRGIGTAAAIVALAAGATPASADTSSQVAGALNFPWPDLLPPLPTAQNPQPGPVPGCAHASPRCVDYEITRMAGLRRRLGCDHRAVFATTYLVLTQTLRATLKRDPRFFADPGYLFFEDALFADYYFRTIADGSAGRPVPEAWRIAFDTAAHGDANAGQDMLLGINAHVQRDMPFVLAGLGLREPEGTSRKRDHDRFNDVLQRAYGPVVEAIARSYDPLLYTTNASWDPVDDAGAAAPVGAQAQRGAALGDLRADAVQDLLGAGPALLGHDHRVLVAAHPAHEIVVADAGGEDAGHAAQDLVAGAVPVRVVDGLQPGHVEREETERTPVAARPRQLAGQPALERTPVQHAGQRVADRQALHHLDRLSPP